MAAKEYTFDLASFKKWRFNENDDDSGKTARYYRALRLAIEDLTDAQKKVFELYYLRGQRVTQIAKLLGRNKSSVSRMIDRIDARIQHDLKFVS